MAPGEPLPPPKPVVTFDYAKLERLASRVQQPSDWVTTLAAVSPLSPAGQSPAAALRALYRAGERVLIFHGNPYTQGDHLYEVPETGAAQREIPGQYLSHPEGVWFLTQPVSGQTYLNPRTGTPSQRSEEAVTSWRYVVLESDLAHWRKWLSILVQLPGCPIAAIYSSGNKSVHALVTVNSKSKREWDEIVRGSLMPLLAPLGADPQAMTAVRLSRLPNAWRGQKRQRLLYLNPNPTDEPICQAPGWPKPTSHYG
jgi:hypothetical protein